MGFDSVALTDTNHMGGAILFVQACQEYGLKPIVGVQLMNEDDPEDAFILLACNMATYSELCELLSHYLLNLERFQSQADFKMIDLLYQGDTTSSQQAKSLPWDQLVIISSSVRHLRDLSRLREEVTQQGGLSHQGVPHKTIPHIYAEVIAQCPTSRKQSRELVTLAQELSIDLIASNANYMIHPHDYELHQTVRAIDCNASLQQLSPRECAPPSAWMKPESQMLTIFERLPEAVANTRVIADLVEDDWHSQPWLMPQVEVPEGYTDDEYLRRCAFEGLDAHFPDSETPFEVIDGATDVVTQRHVEVRQLATKNRPQALEIQEKELEIISNKGYSSYFLMVKQIRDWANQHFQENYRRPKDCSVLRGSAANSITLYNIGASDLDPIRYGLYFERFLNEDRVSPPDADLDFGWDERDQVLEYIIDHFGEDRCAMMCTTNTFRFRSAFREVAKVYGYTDEQITRLMQEWKSESKDADSDRRRGDQQLSQILSIASRLEGHPRFLGQHCGGILITNDPITRHVACQLSGGVKNRKITQVDMHNGIDYLGLIKFDILGNGSLSVLRDALRNIEQQNDDPEVWDLEKCFVDPGVQEILSTSQSRGIFYVESPAQMRLNQKCDARTFEEIGITSSLVRPASAAFTQTFVERHRQYKRGVQEWSFLHPSLAGVLGETHDVVVYQEDVIRICVEIAGLSFAQADKVRKMMNSLHEGEPDNYAETARLFQEGCQQHQGFDEVQAAELWTRISSFQGFSFCQSHSLSYAQLSFKCSYLKAHYGAEFMAAVISNDHGYYGTSIYVDEVRRMGIEVLGPCVIQSEWKYQGNSQGSHQQLRVGLMHVRGLRRVWIEEMIQEREKGPWLSFQDFLNRNPQLGLRAVQSLIQVDAFHSLRIPQPQLLAELNLWRHNGKKKGTHFPAPHFLNELFVNQLNTSISNDILPSLPDITFAEKCYQELELLGYITSGHFLKMLALHPAADHTVAMRDLEHHLYERVKIFGSPMTFRRHRVQASGQEMLFVTMQDISGTSDLVIWPKVYERFYTQTLDKVPLEVWGIPKREDGAITFEVDRIQVASWNPGQVSFLRSVEMKKRQIYAAHQMNTFSGLNVMALNEVV